MSVTWSKAKCWKDWAESYSEPKEVSWPEPAKVACQRKQMKNARRSTNMWPSWVVDEWFLDEQKVGNCGIE